MREIKFRAWDKKEKLMFFIDKPNYGCEYQVWEFKVDFRQNEEIENRLRWYVESDDWEIMQYTGLKDKNGKEIYEGDIIIEEIVNNSLKTEKETKIVFWFKSQSCFKLKSLDNKNHYWLLNFGGSLQPVYEIIGNIYENPELFN